MKALTVHQPWGILIMAAHKHIENRSWSTRHRGLLTIHADRVLDEEGLQRFGDYLGDTSKLPRQAMLGTVVLAAMTRDAQSPWAEAGCYHWVLRDPEPLPEPARTPGHQGLSEWEPDPKLEPLRPSNGSTQWLAEAGAHG